MQKLVGRHSKRTRGGAGAEKTFKMEKIELLLLILATTLFKTPVPFVMSETEDFCCSFHGAQSDGQSFHFPQREVLDVAFLLQICVHSKKGAVPSIDLKNPHFVWKALREHLSKQKKS